MAVLKFCSRCHYQIKNGECFCKKKQKKLPSQMTLSENYLMRETIKHEPRKKKDD